MSSNSTDPGRHDFVSELFEWIPTSILIAGWGTLFLLVLAGQVFYKPFSQTSHLIANILDATTVEDGIKWEFNKSYEYLVTISFGNWIGNLADDGLSVILMNGKKKILCIMKVPYREIIRVRPKIGHEYPPGPIKYKKIKTEVRVLQCNYETEAVLATDTKQERFFPKYASVSHNSHNCWMTVYDVVVQYKPPDLTQVERYEKREGKDEEENTPPPPTHEWGYKFAIKTRVNPDQEQKEHPCEKLEKPTDSPQIDYAYRNSLLWKGWRDRTLSYVEIASVFLLDLSILWFLSIYFPNRLSVDIDDDNGKKRFEMTDALINGLVSGVVAFLLVTIAFFAYILVKIDLFPSWRLSISRGLFGACVVLSFLILSLLGLLIAWGTWNGLRRGRLSYNAASNGNAEAEDYFTWYLSIVISFIFVVVEYFALVKFADYSSQLYFLPIAPAYEPKHQLENTNFKFPVGDMPDIKAD